MDARLLVTLVKDLLLIIHHVKLIDHFLIRAVMQISTLVLPVVNLSLHLSVLDLNLRLMISSNASAVVTSV